MSFPLNHSFEKKAASKDIPRSIHKYVTWVAERGQRIYRMNDDEERQVKISQGVHTQVCD